MAIYKLHHDVRGLCRLVLADIVDGHDPRMRQTAGRARLAKEPLAIVLHGLGINTGNGNGLDGNRAVDAWIAGAKDRAHGAPAKLGENLISSQLLHRPASRLSRAQ